VDSQNRLWFAEYGANAIGMYDPKTEKIQEWKFPTPWSAPYHVVPDKNGELWTGSMWTDRVTRLDPKTKQVKEWVLPTPWGQPYDVVLDKNGEAWTGSMMSDRVSRLDPKTGTYVEYQLPKTTNIRRVFVDNSTTPVTFWVGSNHGASIIKLEPLD